MGVRPRNQYLYTTNLTNSTIQIYDVTRPTGPVPMRHFGGANVSRPIEMAVLGPILYIASNENSTIQLFDISDPSDPMHIRGVNGSNLLCPFRLVITP